MTSTTAQPMTTRRSRNINASMLDQRLDVRLGLITSAEWARRYDAAIVLGMVPSDTCAAYRGTVST